MPRSVTLRHGSIPMWKGQGLSPNAFVEDCRSISVTDQKQLKTSPTLAGGLQEARK